MPSVGEQELKGFLEKEKDFSLFAFINKYTALIKSKEFENWEYMKRYWIKLYKEQFIKTKPNYQHLIRSKSEVSDSVWKELFESVTKETQETALMHYEIHYRKQEKPDYLLEQKEYIIRDNGRSLDVSEKVMLMRQRAIDLAQEGQALVDAYFLLLNYIVFFDNKLSILNNLGLENKTKALKKQLFRNQFVDACSDEIVLLCHSLLKKAKEEEEEKEEKMKIILMEEKIKAMKKKDEEKLLFLTLFEFFYCKIVSVSLHTEQSYIDSTLLPFFEQFFDKIPQTEHMSARGQLERSSAVSGLLVPIDGFEAAQSSTSPPPPSSSNSKKRTRASSSSSSSYSSWFSLFPDYLLKVVSEGTLFDVLAVEVKKPHAKSSQLVNDKAKLANLLKLMLDRLVLSGVPSPVVCGFVDDGEVITTYKMTIREEGRYDFIELACFRGIRYLDDLMGLPSMIEHFKQLKNIVLYMQEIIRVTRLKEALPGPLSLPALIPSEWLRPSQEYPAVVSSRKKQK